MLGKESRARPEEPSGHIGSRGLLCRRLERGRRSQMRRRWKGGAKSPVDLKLCVEFMYFDKNKLSIKTMDILFEHNFKC